MQFKFYIYTKQDALGICKSAVSSKMSLPALTNNRKHKPCDKNQCQTKTVLKDAVELVPNFTVHRLDKDPTCYHCNLIVVA